MEQLFFLLIPLFASSSIILAGNDTSTPTTVLLNTTVTSQWSIDSKTEVQTEKTVTSTSSSKYVDVMTSQTTKTVSTTTAPVTSSLAGSTVGSGFSSQSTSAVWTLILTAPIHCKGSIGQSIITSSTLATPKSFNDTTLNSSSSPAANITGSTDGPGLTSDNTSVGVSVLPNISTTVNSNISISEVTVTPSQAPDSGLTLLAFSVMSLILILIVVMVVLVTAINLRGRCRNTKQHEGIKSCDSVLSDSNITSNSEKESITLVSVRTINTENNTDSPQMSSVRSTIVDNEDQEFTRDLLGFKDGL